MHRLKLN